MKTNQETLLKVRSIVADELNLKLSDVSNNASQEDFAEWDSMAYLSILSEIEDEFKVQVTSENIDNFGSISKIIAEIYK